MKIFPESQRADLCRTGSERFVLYRMESASRWMIIWWILAPLMTALWLVRDERTFLFDGMILLLWVFAFQARDSRTMLEILDRAIDPNERQENREGSAEQISDGNAEKPPGVERDS